ncbi:carbohydrate kinase family protein [Chitinophaga alhagiae]|uniref:Carbohydrate kinase family protein n=1 Tax=Chitinophaga alhagiae TaxID=2203219 RepID=A0ABN5LNN6_9BACT|nr:carbohydrate kinase family protein [Chitinophaga alhagiae]AWO00869.1 carbohydrate kinase family protein [Chitinophaga alhagiae]
MKRFDVIVVGELNVDLIMSGISAFPEVGKEVLGNRMVLVLGSSSAIFASNLASMGVKVAFIGKLGMDVFGDFILSCLEEKGVDTSMIKRSTLLQTGATVALSYGEDRAMVTYPGAMAQLVPADIRVEMLAEARHVHFSSYFLQPGIRPYVRELFRTAKSLGLTTSFDPQWDPEEKWDIDLQQMLPHVDVFLPNEKELLLLTRSSSLPQAIASVTGSGHIIAVKQGGKGSYCCNRQEALFKPAYYNKSVVDAIGAGDSFNAGFIYKFLQNTSLAGCQEFGNLTGAVSTTAAGGTAAFTNFKNLMDYARQKFGYEGG